LLTAILWSLKIDSTPTSLREFGGFRNVTALNWKIGLDQLNGIALKVGIQNKFYSNASSGSKKNGFQIHSFTQLWHLEQQNAHPSRI